MYARKLNEPSSLDTHTSQTHERVLLNEPFMTNIGTRGRWRCQQTRIDVEFIRVPDDSLVAELIAYAKRSGAKTERDVNSSKCAVIRMVWWRMLCYAESKHHVAAMRSICARFKDAEVLVNEPQYMVTLDGPWAEVLPHGTTALDVSVSSDGEPPGVDPVVIRVAVDDGRGRITAFVQFEQIQRTCCEVERRVLGPVKTMPELQQEVYRRLIGASFT